MLRRTLSLMGILLLITGVFIIMGGLQLLAVGLVGLALIGVFVLGSMVVGKVFFHL
jgi:hypothetical protein